MRRRTGLAISLTMLAISVAGFPLAVGFLGKLFLFEAGWQAGLLPLLIVLILSSVIAFAYYLRIILIMWVKEPAERFERTDGMVYGTVYACAFAVVLLLVMVGPLQTLANEAAASLMP